MRYAPRKDERTPYLAPEMARPARPSEDNMMQPLTMAALALAAAILVGIGIGSLAYEFYGRSTPAKVDAARNLTGEIKGQREHQERLISILVTRDPTNSKDE